MFTTLIDTTSGTISLESAVICIAAAVILGLISAFVYQKSADRYSKSFIITLALLPVLVESVIIMTSGNLGTAVAVAGTFSLVRFRSAPGTSKEIVSVFFSMAIGLACGMGQIGYAVLITVIISLLMLVLMKSSFGGRDLAKKNLRVTIPEELDYSDIFDDLFEKYTISHRLNKVKTVNLGSLYELDYDLELKDPAQEKELLDHIRTRNGNLTVVCGRKAENITTL